MSEPIANTTRAALEVARVALGRMMGAPPAPGAPRTVPVTMAARASEAWKNTEILLRLITSRPDLAGQALLTESRRVDALDMEGMHALVAMREWVERTLAPGSAAQMLTLPPTDAEREVASNALAALDRAMGVAPNTGANASFGAPSSIPAQPESGPPSQWAPQATPASKLENPWRPAPGPQLPYDHARKMPVNTLETAKAEAALDEAAYRARDGGHQGNSNIGFSDGGANKRSVSSGLIMLALFLVVAIGGGGAWYALREKGASSTTQDGVDAYTRGAKEAARIAFAKAIQENPQDVRALTYMGRVSREQGDLATSRKYLENAIRIDPNNELALRELASALLADDQYELSRRFYVRALTVDPTDRIAQGFLACALTHLNRNDEAARWTQRAGPGDWSRCATSGSDPPAKD